MIRELIMQDELMRNRELLIAASGNHFCYFCYFCGTSFAAGGKPFSDSPKIQIKGKKILKLLRALVGLRQISLILDKKKKDF